MFEGTSDGSWTDRYFFGPEMRNAIMKAGRDTTLLRVLYAGTPRIIEPYALKFQERKDGVAKEYLYVFDKTGSKNNPGWKTFVAENTEVVENTEDKFAPQFEIELRKASEYPTDRYLYDKSKKDAEDIAKLYKLSRPSRPGRQRIYGSSFTGPKYVFKCSTCGKFFYRKNYDATLSEHKNKSGYPCYGYGIYLRMKY
jgi:hypothetical protein